MPRKTIPLDSKISGPSLGVSPEYMKLAKESQARLNKRAVKIPGKEPTA